MNSEQVLAHFYHLEGQMTEARALAHTAQRYGLTTLELQELILLLSLDKAGSCDTLNE